MLKSSWPAQIRLHVFSGVFSFLFLREKKNIKFCVVREVWRTWEEDGKEYDKIYFIKFSKNK